MTRFVSDRWPFLLPSISGHNQWLRKPEAIATTRRAVASTALWIPDGARAETAIGRARALGGGVPARIVGYRA